MKFSDDNAQRTRTRLYQSIGFGFLGLHFYTECYYLFDHWGWSSRITDEVLFHLRDTRLLNTWTAKSIALLFILLSVLDYTPRKQQDFSRIKNLLLVLAGGFLYFGSQLVFVRIGNPATTCLSYLLITSSGFALIVMGLSRLKTTLNLPWVTKDPFGREQAGFPQERSKLTSSFSLHLPAQFKWKGQKKDSWINLINPRRGVLIMGSPGSGKSYFIIEPLLRQWMEKGHIFFLYDFKSPALTQLAYNYFKTYQDRLPPGTKFYSINFNDLAHSHRCNVLAPATLEQLSDALGASRTIMLSINKTWANKQGDFFVESSINFLGALIWFLRQYDKGIYCTLPHVIELSQLSYEELFPVLSTNQEIKGIIAPFQQALKDKTNELLNSQIASARIPLGRLASPEIYYILTGNDLNLDINNPAAPAILCLAGSPSRQEAIAPMLSLCIDQLNKQCNQPNRLPCALFCDEFATVRAFSLHTTIATGRSNNIVPIIAIQDLSQLRTQYSRDEADLFLNISGNLLCGQVGGDTAKWVSERFPKIQQPRESISVNSNDSSLSIAPQWEPTMTAATIGALSSGEFVGITADEPGMEMELKAFHAKLQRKEKRFQMDIPLPTLQPVTNEMISRQFVQIKDEISNLVAKAERSDKAAH